MKFKFTTVYFLSFILLLLTEILIATFLVTGFIRHTFGDFLVVILIYCFLKSFLDTKPIYLALAVLAFSFLIEFLQLFQLLKLLNLENNHMAKLILGSTFHVSDLIAYTLGILFILIVESNYTKHAST
ncbi:uncharacterized protein DUF2809 [Gelidibacter algens]|uniref:Uncharacterized protein DUF2809 n=1 Tax=Gelidibacter algens TaxID=49280 RepID=A0A1A7R698_9FLAO|nr:DUF2809 domain-containing protein [Gelidibacter algens]OBX27023.1 hypothetical protein A9996_01145 [Gelidibacter algens]RAJ28035.1 uncharacterized protein DUF2809 [Gelidibacter algens]